jgi:hypothetical protein
MKIHIHKDIYSILTYAIAIVWIANGLFCKVLNLVTRHEQIVARILDNNHSRHLTIFIGCLEIIMAIWILVACLPKLNAIVQIVIVATMNILEFILVPDLLLFGKLNAFFALVFILVVYYHGFYLSKNKTN